MKERNGMSCEQAARLGGMVEAKKKQQREKQYLKNSNRCTQCDTALPYDKRKNQFCGHSCSATFHNVGKARNCNMGKYILKPCLHCQEITRNTRFCTHKCHSLYSKEQRRAKIKQTEILVHYQKDKWYLIETRGHKCEICDLSKWMNEKIPLDVDHIDGDSDNNSLKNVRLVCPNCHRQTKNHGSKNQNGRHSKRKAYRKRRYQEGKSY